MKRFGAVLLVAAVSCAGPSAAEEGLWTYDAFPAEAVEKAYGFRPDQAFLDHLRLSSVMIDACSAALVSARGLIQTNHHCVNACIEALSQKGQDLNMTPVLAATEADEKTCPGAVAEVLVDLDDVTARVIAAGKAATDDDEGRRAEIAAIETDCGSKVDKGRCQVVTLFAGAKYALHTYRTYEDVRLVLGPEGAAGSFGGDPDNFNFPRFAFDVAYLRIYEDGKPVSTPNHLEWRSEPLKEGELLFVSGHPGETGRNTPMALVDFYVDTYFPWALVTDSELRGRLIAYAAQGTEQARVASTLLFNIENWYKANWAEHAALMGGLIGQLRENETKLRAAIAADPALTAEVGDAYEALERAQKVNRQLFYPRRYFNAYAASQSSLYEYGLAIVLAAGERLLPEGVRLDGYSDSDMPDLADWMSEAIEIQPAKEELVLSFWLSKMREFLTADHPTVKAVLGKESPEDLAKRVVATTRLGNPAERRRLFDGGIEAVEASDDPMIVLLRIFAAEGREIEARQRDEVLTVNAEARRRIDAARVKLAGTATYPDATGTLRLNYGKVDGWTEPNGRVVTPFTTFAGLLERATGADPFKLADRWEAAKGTLSPGTILNVSTTNDTVGGNSGSPIVDREGRLVGAMFDGNIHSLGGYYLFDPVLNRSVIIASTAIEEALPKVYGLQRIVDELKQ